MQESNKLLKKIDDTNLQVRIEVKIQQKKEQDFLKRKRGCLFPEEDKQEIEDYMLEMQSGLVEEEIDSEEEQIVKVVNAGTMLMTCVDWIIFRHESIFSRAWYNFITLLSLVSCIYYVFPWIYGENQVVINVFHYDHSDEKNYIPGQELFPYLQRFDFLVEIVFFLNILKNFLTDFPQENSQKPQRSLAQIAIRYIKGAFFFDLLAFFPFQLFT